MSGPSLSMRGPVALGGLALAVLVLGFGLWAVTARLSGAIVLQGRVETDQTRLPVQHPDGGVVAAVHVAEGQVVVAGAVLLTLDGRALRSDLGIVEDRLGDLAARAARLAAERDQSADVPIPPDLQARAAGDADLAAQIAGQLALFQARRATQAELAAQLERRIAQVRAHAGGLAAQREALGLELALVEGDLADQQQLFDRGLVIRAGVLALQREEARLTGGIAELAASIAEAEGQVTEIEIQISGLAVRRQEEAEAELREIEPQLLELAERRRVLIDRIARLDLRAPVAGTVLGLQVAAPGAVLRDAEPALTLVPTGRPLVVTARLSPAQVDEVRPGQAVELKLSALADRAAPHLAGRVTRVSPDTLTDPATGSEHFVIRVELQPGEGQRFGEGALGPGMPVEVFLETRARTPLAYLWEPFGAYFNRALRES